MKALAGQETVFEEGLIAIRCKGAWGGPPPPVQPRTTKAMNGMNAKCRQGCGCTQNTGPLCGEDADMDYYAPNNMNACEHATPPYRCRQHEMADWQYVGTHRAHRCTHACMRPPTSS